jgi:molybdate transport system permease protein
MLCNPYLKECYSLSKNILRSIKEVLSIGSRDDIFQSPGTVQAARLTGCKNITPIKYGAERMKIRAVNWGCELMVGEDRRDATHIGIREHHIRLVEDPNEPNTFPAWAEQITETPFAVIMFMRLDNQAADSELLQLTLTKEDYRARAERPYPWFVQLKPEHLFLMAGD